MDEKRCPQCNCLIKEGQVYCPECGYDIQMVPEFDAELEKALDETLSKMLEGINFKDMSEEEFEELSEGLDENTTMDLRRKFEMAKTRDLDRVAEEVRILEEKKKKESERERHKKELAESARKWIFPVIFMLMALLGVFFYERSINADTPEGLMERGRKAEEAGNFEEAAGYYNSALEKDPGSEDAFCALARAWYGMGDNIRAEDYLLSKIAQSPSQQLYETLIRIYEQEDNYQSISTLLAGCEDEQLREAYSRYIADPPSFDTEDGSYDEPIEVEIHSKEDGLIFYTLDGSEPDANSLQYEGPILIEEGKTVVRAVFVNILGVRSQSVSGIFEVKSPLPDEPEVTPESGTYGRGGYIEAKAGEDCTIYYTDDGSLPDEDSKVYEEPILMKQGDQTYRFMAVDMLGRRSNITSVQYTLALTTVFSENEALNYLLTALMLTGKILDLDGADGEGGAYTYKCVGMLTQDGFTYYMLEETFKGPEAGESVPTGEYFTVETTLGLLGRAQRGNDGYFKLSGF